MYAMREKGDKTMKKETKNIPLVKPSNEIVEKAERLNRDSDILDAAVKYVISSEILDAYGISVSDWHTTKHKDLEVEIVNSESGDKEWKLFTNLDPIQKRLFADLNKKRGRLG